MQNKIVAVIGGSGFIGRHVVQHLAKQGALIKVGCRDVNQAMPLLPMGMVGQIKLFTVNVRDEASLHALIKGSDYVINLVGVLSETTKQKFSLIHHEAAERVAKICLKEGVHQLIHFSSLGADINSSSAYAKTKAEGETAIQRIFPKALILRPSLVFGAEDQFFNRFASMATISPFIPLLYGGRTKFQPVFVADIAQAVVAALLQNSQGDIVELGGPTVYTFKELMQLMLKTINRTCLLIPVPGLLGYGIGACAQWLPNPLLTIDQVRLLKRDNVLTNKKPGFQLFNISPQTVEAIIPTYLRRFRKQ